MSALYLNGVGHIQSILKEIEAWMDRKGYDSIDQFRGKLNVANSKEKWTYKRAQYVRHLLNSEKYIRRDSAL